MVWSKSSPRPWHRVLYEKAAIMTLYFMRIIDDCIGMWICKLLGACIKIKCILIPPHTDIAPDKVRKILCQKYLGMGSILNAIPLMKGLRKQYPNAKIIFITTKSNRKIIPLCNMADEVLFVNFDSFSLFIKDVVKNLFYLMREGIDISIDLEFFAKFSMLVSILSMSKVRVGLYHNKIRPEGILTHKIYYNPYKHISEIYFAYAVALSIERKEEYFKDIIPSFKSSFEKSVRENFSLKTNTKIIVINVNAGELFIFRRWPASYFVELIKLLVKNYPEYYYILIGGKFDYEYVDDIYKKTGVCERLINAAGLTSIEELFTLIEMSYLVITNDSGPLHIASLYGKNIVVLFGPETPIIYGPTNSNALIFYADDIYCSPCMSVYDSKKSLYGETCIENRCLLKFKPEEVYSGIEQHFLNHNNGK